MEPTIRPGDYILSDNWSRGVRRGDVVFFNWPEEDNIQSLGRLIGIPGDTLAMRNKVLLIQGQQIAEPQVQHGDSADVFLPVMLWQRAHITATDTASYLPSLNTWGPLVVPPGMHFILGDNRYHSRDSRFRGFVPAERIDGRLHRVYFSWDSVSRSVRWSRIGKGVG
jgi:signal peptidase I